jgi:hypothetical protein
MPVYSRLSAPTLTHVSALGADQLAFAAKLGTLLSHSFCDCYPHRTVANRLENRKRGLWFKMAGSDATKPIV